MLKVCWRYTPCFSFLPTFFELTFCFLNLLLSWDYGLFEELLYLFNYLFIFLGGGEGKVIFCFLTSMNISYFMTWKILAFHSVRRGIGSDIWGASRASNRLLEFKQIPSLELQASAAVLLHIMQGIKQGIIASSSKLFLKKCVIKCYLDEII